jgi:hypothetical protein
MTTARRKFQRPLGERRYFKLFIIATEGYIRHADQNDHPLPIQTDHPSPMWLTSHFFFPSNRSFNLQLVVFQRYFFLLMQFNHVRLLA